MWMLNTPFGAGFVTVLLSDVHRFGQSKDKRDPSLRFGRLHQAI